MKETIRADFSSYDNAENALHTLRKKGMEIYEYKIRFRVKKSNLEEYAFFGFPAVTLPEQSFTMMAYSSQYEPNRNEGQVQLSLTAEKEKVKDIHAILYNQHATNVQK